MFILTYYYSLILKGDNLLTALCVARKCEIVPKNNKVIIIEAYPNKLITNNEVKSAYIEWKLAEDNINEIEYNNIFNVI